MRAKAAVDERPTWHPIAIEAAPRIRCLYWCRFNDPSLVPLPEMWKERPVIVVGHRELYIKGSCLVVPTSTDPQENNKWAWKLPSYLLGGTDTWVLYSHLVTISTSRLKQVGGVVPKLRQEDFDELLRLIREYLPKPLS